MADPKKRVFILGAGFTKAFLPGAPLLVDDYYADKLLEKYAQFPEAIRILEADRARNKGGRLNLERLMTRIDGRMPYDDQANDGLNTLLSDLKNMFRLRLIKAKEGIRYDEDLARLARYCINHRIHCITFNYDDFFDEALSKVVPKRYREGNTKPQWNPTSGYGFFCKPSLTCIGNYNYHWDNPAMRLLKLHGSINWRVRLGSSKPYAYESIVHHEGWLPEWSKPHQIDKFKSDLKAVSIHLESDPFIVPPVLFKSALTEQPILKLIWAWANSVLSEVEEVTFIGYSMPTTDIAAGFLFSETLEALPMSSIKIVNLARPKKAKEALKQAYRTVFPRITESQFDFRDARKWALELINKEAEGEV